MKVTQDMTWVSLPVDSLKPAAYNPRKKLKKGDKEYEKIKKSIVEFGYVDPIIVNFDGTVIGGHQRLTVLSDLGYKEVQCVQVRIDDENKVKALNVALNKITGAWNEELLADLMVDLQDADFNLDLTGFEAPEIDQLFSKVHNKEVKEDDFDVDGELTKPTISKQGDIWHLGKHRVICGDSTKLETYQLLLGDKKANLVVTDPPYNVNVTEGLNFRRAFKDAGFYLSGCCVWKKNALVLGRSPYQWQHEPVLYGWKQKGKHQWFSDRKQTTIWEYDRPKSSKEHPTMKPVQLMAYPIQNSSMRGTLILDPFLGSGSTLIAADQTGRICYGIELDEKFVDVIVKRYMEATEKTDVKLIREGRTLFFEEAVNEMEEAQ